ncbi:hypothetical protein ACFL1R_10210, partial [Candidatus Latescibacterota bacterium]
NCSCLSVPKAREFCNSRKTRSNPRSSRGGKRLFTGRLCASRLFVSFRSFLWTSKEKDISINKKSGSK